MPAQFDWPAKVGPTSKVIKDPQNWRDEGILVPHEAIRWWNQNILDILQTFDPIGQPTTKWKTKVFFDWYDNYYFVCIHHHHDAEENIYNPGIEAKLGRPVDGNIKSDHDILLTRLDQVKTYRARIEGGNAAALKEFKEFMKGLIEFMNSHLEEEERNYPTALKESGLTPEEEGAIVGQIIQGLGLDGNKKFLPPIAYCMSMWKGVDGMNEWLSTKVPPPIQLMFHKCWISDFYENQLRVLEALKQPEEFTPKTPECALCTLM